MIDRRKILLAIFAFKSVPNVLANEVVAYNDPIVSDNWIREWMSLTRAPRGALHLVRFSDGLYALTRRIGWAPNSAGALSAVTVPKGFVTDFASIPRVFWTVLPKDGRYTYAAVIHDHLYWVQTTSREEADKIFYECMLDFGVDVVQREAIHLAVRLGGGSAWENNSRLRQLGEKRVLRALPDDPTISWEDWKQRAENF